MNWYENMHSNWYENMHELVQERAAAAFISGSEARNFLSRRNKESLNQKESTEVDYVQSDSTGQQIAWQLCCLQKTRVTVPRCGYMGSLGRVMICSLSLLTLLAPSACPMCHCSHGTCIHTRKRLPPCALPSTQQAVGMPSPAFGQPASPGYIH